MSSLFRRSSRLAVALLTLAVLPLGAQVNPKWQTTSSPDFLELYQKSSTLKAKPEIVAVFDFSGSMQAMMYHKDYPAPSSDDYGSNENYFSFTLLSKTIGSTTYYYPRARLNGSSSAGLFPDTASYLDSYTFVRPDGSLLIGQATTPTTVPTDADIQAARTKIRNTNNTISTPWGSVAIPAYFSGSTAEQDIRNWVRGASHIRINHNSKNIDIPLNWTVLDETSSGYPLSPAVGHDTVAIPAVDYPVDSTYTIGDGNFTSTRITYLSAYLSSSATTCTVNSGTAIPAIASPNFMYVTIGREIVKVTAHTSGSTTWTIQRGQLGTTAAAWGSGSNVYNYAANVTIPNDATQYCRNSARYRGRHMRWIFGVSEFAGQNNIPTADTKPAFQNTIPAMNRVQACKLAATRTWLANQTEVFFAFRFLSHDGNGESDQSEINSNSRINPWTGSAYFCANPWETSCSYSNVIGKDRSWTLMNGNTLGGLRRLSYLSPGNSTPLTVALANAYAQMLDPNNVFNDAETGDDKPVDCMNHVVLLFTDGNPNSEPGDTENNIANPYLTTASGVTSFSADTGNEVIITDTSVIDSTDTAAYFNVGSLAAAAAHLADGALDNHMATPGTYPANTDTSKTVKDFLPFTIKERGTGSEKLTYTEPNRITTMTFGVSLGGSYTTGSKGRLFLAAIGGNPEETTYADVNALTPYTMGGDGKKTENSVFFFDATDAATMEQYLGAAFKESKALKSTNVTAAPVLPTIGSGLGAAVYLTKFEPPEEGGPVWPGDLLMYPIKEDENGITHLLDAAGNSLSGSDLAVASKARWAASLILSVKGWSNRAIYTRLPATSGTVNPPMTRVTVTSSDTAAGITDAGYNAIKSLLPGATAADKFDNWRYFIGAEVGSTTSPKPTRLGIMGDVVNSTPAVLDYSTMPDTISTTANKALTDAWAAHSGDNRKFRVIFVGTNGGFLHAFGEVSWDDDSSGSVLQNGVADELWAFAPTDLLKYVNHYRNSSNGHRFAVDGSPTVYLMDMPVGSAVRGNGVFDVSSTTERALLIFGLGKGGRSYYAIDVRDPARPVFKENATTYGNGMGWSLCPDETDNYPGTRFVAPASASTSTITQMGLSTSVPTLGRIVATSDTLVKDVVFLGGGYSNAEIENTNLPNALFSAANGYPPPYTATPLGRSVLTLEAKTGNILGVWDMHSDESVGPVLSGVVPYSFFSGSGLHQRAYFADYFGGVWALGSTDRYPSGNLTNGDFRVDTSWLDEWASYPRPIYKQGIGNGVISSMPIPFAVPNMPTRTSAPLSSPAAVGIAFVTGDRNNPVDRFYTAQWPKPTQHRVNVIFDRQDSYSLGLDSNGINSSTQVVDASTLTTEQRTPSDDDFYLKSKYGYYINFPATSGDLDQYRPKGMFSPLLLGGRLFYSYFAPTKSDPCSGGAGYTETFRIQNVMLPDPTTADAPNSYSSGRVLYWTGMASPFTIRSLVTGLQAGMSSGSGTTNDPTSKNQNLQAQTLDTGSTDIYPKPRIWRTVH